MDDWTGLGGFIVGVPGVIVSGGSWIWAARASRAAARAEKSADEVRATVEALADRFAREASEQAELIVLRVGSGVNVVNKSSHALRSVGVAPVGDAFDWNGLARVGDIDPLRTGAANVEELYSDWPSSVFRAITRAITRGQSGVFTVTRGR